MPGKSGKISKFERMRAVTAEEFRRTADVALDAAVSLMASCCKYNKAALLKGYVTWSASAHLVHVPDMFADEGPGDIDDFDWEDEAVAPPEIAQVESRTKNDKNADHADRTELRGSDADCYAIMAQLQAREVADAKPWDQDNLPDMDDAEAARLGSGPVPPPPVLDLDSWKAISTPRQADEEGCVEVASVSKVLTLSVALSQRRLGGVEIADLDQCEDVKGWLWVLLKNLKAKSDERLIPDLLRCRRPPKALNWYQHCEHEAALVRQQFGAPAKRTSRAAAWRALKASLRDACEGTDACVQELATAMVVLAMPACSAEWRVGLVLSVWRRRGATAYPTCPCPWKTSAVHVWC